MALNSRRKNLGFTPLDSKHLTGFTLVELLISMVILTIVFLPLIKIMTSSFRSWWFSKRKMTIQEDGREVMSFLRKEAEAAFRYSLGSYVYNGGFEERDEAENKPSGWVLANADFNMTASTSPVYSGFSSVSLHPGGSVYTKLLDAFMFDVPRDIDNVVFSFKAKSSSSTPSDITGEVMQSGSPVITVSAASVSTSTWQTIVTTATLPQGDDYYVVIRSNNGDICVDEVSLVPQTSILVHPTESATMLLDGKPAYTYTSQLFHSADVSAGSSVGYNQSAIRVETRTSKSGRTIYRLLLYTIQSSGDALKTKFYNALGENINMLEFILDSTELSTKGPDVPVTIILRMEAPVTGGENIYYTLRTTVYPRQ